MPTSSPGPLLEILNLRTSFYTPEGIVRAVDGVDLAIGEGEILGVVGESGSGKSVLNLTVLGLLPSPPAVVESGSISFRGQNLLTFSAGALRRVRGDRIAMIFQDPMTSLNPFLTIGDQVSEPLVIHRGAKPQEARERTIELLRDVGIPAPERRLHDYPHQFSGGMRQRVMIAMALALEPDLLIADEPTTALDVTIQAQILQLLREIRERRGTSILIVTHDLGVVAAFCDRVAVMYAGRIIEQATTGDLFARPAHPYTESLLRSSPRLDDPSHGRLFSIPGRPPDLAHLPAGCAFRPRCPYAFDQCEVETPPLEDLENDKRKRACFLPYEQMEGVHRE